MYSGVYELVAAVVMSDLEGECVTLVSWSYGKFGKVLTQ